ncbi:hypothetical protein V2J09_023867 [Rumex salicifolius]
MSWLARSLANSFGIDDDAGEQNPQQNTSNLYNKSSFSDRRNRPHEEFDEDQSNGVKEDLSELKDTITRQLLGVANFLAPSPPPPPPPPPPRLAVPRKYLDQVTVSEFDPSELSHPSSVSGNVGLSIQDQIDGENGDQSEVGGLDVGGISRFSVSDRVQAVPEDFQLDCKYEQLRSMTEEPDWVHKAVGVTDEVLAFAGNIAHHPETWLDFPIEEEDDLDDFKMSESQKEHAFSIECLTPRLKALRIELCPALLSEGYFWKVYFVLLHSRLNRHDSKLLSTSQVVEARAKWMHELQKRTKEELERQRFYKENAFLLDDFSTSSPSSQQPDWTFSSEPACSSVSYDSETEKHPITTTETEFVDKLVIEETPVIKTVVDKYSHKMLLQSFDDDDDDNDNDWPEDDFLVDGKGVTAIPSGIEEEVSFSDLEDDDCSIHLLATFPGSCRKFEVAFCGLSISNRIQLVKCKHSSPNSFKS